VKLGSLSDYFVGVGAKILRGTEVDPLVSNGHELQGISRFREFLGQNAKGDELPLTYVWLSDDEPPVSLSLTATWYDSRKNQPHRSAEYRFYYPAEAESIVYKAKAGDTLVLCQPKDGPLLALFCAHGSTIEQQLLWLFGLSRAGDNSLVQQDLREEAGRPLDLVARYILELIGVEVISTEEEWLERLLAKFGGGFPGTRDFSEFARNAVTDVDGRANPDQALLSWMDFEERLFMTLEKHIVAKRLEQGFMANGKANVDDFVSFSLSVHNRRKSRAGWAFGNHVEQLLQLHGLKYKREATTEKRNGPDFLFPDEKSYHDPAWPVERLTMLGVKTSCKDRWRQVLAEADRIERKHLLTLEPGISETQTAEMITARLQLVIPRGLFQTFKEPQMAGLMDVGSFLKLVSDRQQAGQ
jgi:EcoRII C terminal